MSQLTIANKSQLLAAATAIAAAGFLTVSPPAQAHPMLPLAPACSQYSFPNGDWPIQINGKPYVIQTHHGANAAGRVLGSDGKFVGSVTSGGIYKNSANSLILVSFTITYNENVMETYAGNVEDDGLVHVGLVGSSSPTAPTWISTRPLECNDAPPAPAPAQQPAPPAAAASLGVAVTGPTTLQTGMSGTFTVTVANKGDVDAPGDLYISYGGKLEQMGQIAPSGSFQCEVINNAGGSTAVHCTVTNIPPHTSPTIQVQGRGMTPGPGHLTATINSDPAVQIVQKSQQLNVSIT